MSVEIREVTSKKELKKFVKFNIELYKGNPYHVPGLIEEEMMTLDKKKNPAFEVCDAIYFLAYKDGKVVGRIAGMVNRPSNEAWDRNVPALVSLILLMMTRWLMPFLALSRNGPANKAWRRSTVRWALPIWITRVC